MNLVIWLLCSLSLSVGYTRINLPFFKLGATATATASASASASSNDKLFKPSFESDSEEETQLFPSQANCELKIDVVGDAAPTVFRFEINKATKETKTCWRNGVATWPLCKDHSTFSIWKYVNNATFSRCTMPTYCEPEHFHHFYERRGGKLQHFNNRWKRAKVGERVGLHEICLKANGLPLTRMCLFDEKQQLPVWENIDAWPQIVCLNETREKIITPQLNMLHDEMLDGKLPKNTTLQRHNILSRIHTLLSEPNYKHLPADVHLTRQILVSVMEDDSAKDAANAPDILEICKDVMFMDSMVLRMSAKGLNATNGLLETFESYMDALTPQIIPQSHCGIKSPNITQLINQTLPKAVEILDQSDLGVYGLLSANLSVYFVNPRCSQISGIAIYNPHTKVSKKPLKHSADNSFLYRFVYTNESAENLLQESGLEIAAFLPLSLWQKLETNASLLPMSHTLLVFKVYAHDGLFVENAQLQSRKPFSKVLSISIPGFHGHLPEEFPFILRNNHPPPANGVESGAPQGTGCGYWNYDTWVSDGVQTIASKQPPNKQQKDLILCRTNHLTSFSYLLGGSYKQSDLGSDVLITPLHQQVLDIISIIGCSLSLLGLLAIWLTAALFKNWRSQASTKVLLNLCLALTLQMTLFVFVNTDDMSEHLIQERSYINCIALGAALQYSILVLFSWMLIAAFLQFQRYVTVLGIQRPTHYILKSAVAAWGFPLIPTLLVAFIDPHSYIPNDYQLNTDTGICYPSGHGLLFGVIIPVALIVIANFTIFIYVCWSISYTLSQSMQRHERKLIMKQIRLSVLLFFLLGLTWIFGILAFMRAGIVFSYLFCLTATMQGFVLFIYFVVLDKTTQNAWFDLLCPKIKDGNTNKTSELQSITSTGSTTAGVSSEVSKTATKP